MRHRILHSFLFILLTLILSACIPEATIPSFDDLFGGSSTELEQERLIYISSETIPCGEATCLLIRNNEEDSWEQLQVAIIGFEYSANTAYTLRVREDVISDTPVLRLVDILSQSLETPIVEEVETAEGEAVESTESGDGTEVEGSEVTEEVVSEATSEETTSEATVTTTSEEATTEEASESETTEETEATQQDIIEIISERELLLFIDQVLGACDLETDDRCLRVRENRTDAWRNITGTIANFDYIPGNYYVLRVLERSITTQKPATEETTILEYSLVDLVSQTPATQEKLVYIGPEILSCDEVAAERCYQYKESRSLDYDAKAMDIIGFNHLDGYAYALSLLATLDENGQVRDYELVEVVSKELLADGRFIEKVIYVGPELVECAFGPSGLCYVFRETVEEPFRVLTAEITGFKHQAGFDYELKVRQQVSQPTIDLSTTTLELVEIIYQEAVVVEGVIEEEPEVVEETSEVETVDVEGTEQATEESTEENAVENIEETIPTISETIAGAAQAQLENTATENIEEVTDDSTSETASETTSETAVFPAPVSPPEVERRNVTITVAPPAQAALAVPTLPTVDATETENVTEAMAETTTETIAEVATEVSEEDSVAVIEETVVVEAVVEETVEEEPVVSAETTASAIIDEAMQVAQVEKSVPVADFGDLEATDERTKIIFIGSSYQECDLAGQPQWCYLSKENLNDEWFLLPFGIENFDYKEGFVYVIRVKETFFGDDPETGLANYKLELISVLAETEDKSISIVKEAERLKEQTAALEEAAVIAQTFEEEAAVIKEEEVVDRTEEYLAEAQAIAADTQAAKEAYEQEQALIAEAKVIEADTQAALQIQADAEAIAADTQAALKAQAEAAAKLAAEEAKRAEEAAIKQAEEEAKQAAEEAAIKAEEEEAEAKRIADAEAAAAKQGQEAAEAIAAEVQAAMDARNSDMEVVEQSESTMTVTPATPTIEASEVLLETKTVYIAEQLTRCQPEGMAEQFCYAYKETPEDEWQLLYNEIVNFEFFEGYIYELEVIEYIAQDLPIELGRWFEVIEMTNAFPVVTGN